MITNAEVIARLASALRDAREAVENWGECASPFEQEKYDLAGDLSRIDAVLAEIEREGSRA